MPGTTGLSTCSCYVDITRYHCGRADKEEIAIDTRRTSAAAVLIVIVFMLSAMLVSCVGPAEEDMGGADTDATASSGTTESVEASAGPRARVAIYLVDGDVIVPVMREVAAGDLDSVVAALIAGPTESDQSAVGSELMTEIPAEAEVVSVSRDGEQISIDVTEPFVSDGGSLGVRLRLAQLTYTLTGLQDVESVLLRVDGAPILLVGDGLEIENPLTREHYASVVPDVLIESPLSGDTVGTPIVASGIAKVPGTEFILRLIDAGGSVVTERLVSADTDTGLFGVEVEYSEAESGVGTLQALSLDEDVLMGISVNLE